MALQLKVGGVYRDREGLKTTILRHHATWRCPFEADNGQNYHADGRYDHEQGECVWDLIAEWSEPATPDADGWITWAGGECPVPPGELRSMQFKWANGDVTYGIVAPEWFSTVGEGLKGYRVLDMPTEQMRQKWPVTMHTPAVSAPAILEAAAGHMRDRAATYDVPTGERSMARTVAVFNALHGLALTEAQGWSFMAVLKHVRAFQSGRFHGDSVEDMAAYVSLMGEAQARTEGGE